MKFYYLFLALLSTCLLHGEASNQMNELISVRDLSELKSYEGKKIYQGDVTPVGEDVSKYYYIRYAADVDGNHKITHVTFSKDDKKLVVQSSNQDKEESLVSYDEVHLQKNYLGTIKVDKNKVKIIKIENGEIESNTEELGYPVVVGPTLFGYIQNHWSELLAGDRLKIKFGLIERLETFGFDVYMKSTNELSTTIILTPSNFLMKLFVDDLEVDFDTKSKRVKRYKGPVPQYDDSEGNLEKVVATSVYKYVVGG